MNIPTKIFIVPYKNRLAHKTHFEVYMKYILEDIPNNEYEIFFVHQLQNQQFNRGAMKNIGFLAMKDKYPNDYKNISFIFNDIDTLPCIKNVLNYDTTHGTIKHFYGFKFALGGIFSIKGGDFEKCGGFPNFWGWGLEDNTMNYRANQSNITIDRSVFFPIMDDNIIQLTNGLHRILTKQDVWNYDRGKVTETFRDIKNLVYEIENEFIQVKMFQTKENPNNQTFYNASGKNLSTIGKDKNFIPKNSTHARLKKMF